MSDAPKSNNNTHQLDNAVRLALTAINVNNSKVRPQFKEAGTTDTTIEAPLTSVPDFITLSPGIFLGSNGVLPNWILEAINEWEALVKPAERTTCPLRVFLNGIVDDILQSRVDSELFASTLNGCTDNYRSSSISPYARYILKLLGLSSIFPSDHENSNKQEPSLVTPEEVISCAALLCVHPPNAMALQQILQTIFPAYPIEVRDQPDQAEICIGPLDWDAHKSFLPHNRNFCKLASWTRLYAGSHTSFTLSLTLITKTIKHDECVLDSDSALLDWSLVLDSDTCTSTHAIAKVSSTYVANHSYPLSY